MLALYLRNDIIRKEQAKAAERPETELALEQPTFHEDVEKATLSFSSEINVVYKLSDLENHPREPFDFGGFSPIRLYCENGYSDEVGQCFRFESGR